MRDARRYVFLNWSVRIDKKKLTDDGLSLIIPWAPIPKLCERVKRGTGTGDVASPRFAHFSLCVLGGFARELPAGCDW